MTCRALRNSLYVLFTNALLLSSESYNLSYTQIEQLIALLLQLHGESPTETDTLGSTFKEHQCKPKDHFQQQHGVEAFHFYLEYL